METIRTLVASVGLLTPLLVCGACGHGRPFLQTDALPRTPVARAPDGEPHVIEGLSKPIASAEPISTGLFAENSAVPAGLPTRSGFIDGDLFGESPFAHVLTDPALVVDASAELPVEYGSAMESLWIETRCKLGSDYGNYFSWITIRDLMLGIGLAAVVANTSMDQEFRDWYQEDVRSSGTDDAAAFWKTFGEGQIFIPAFAGLAIAGTLWEDTPCGSTVADFGCRSTRAYLVGAPPMLLMQFALGASRPGERTTESRWTPWDDNNAVSGHAFMGAVPFITAARMTKNPYLKGGLYFSSSLTAWSRVNDDGHYLSQALLGWWMAYLACRAVDQTEYDDRNLTFTPVSTPEIVGMGAIYER